MDTKKYAQGDQLTMDFVRSCPPQKNVGVIVSDAEEVSTKFGTKLCVRVNINDALLKWTMNTTSVKNMQRISSDSLQWLSKRVAFTIVISKDSKEQLIGTTMMD